MPPPIVRSNLTPTFGYNVKAGRYVSPQGRFVARTQVRAALDTTLQRSQDEIRYLSRDLQNGRIGIAEWQTAMAKEIRNAHRASAALAKGGWAQMTSDDNGKLGPLIKDQLSYLANFGKQIETGEQSIDGAGFLNRANMYGEAARGTYEESRRGAMADGGMTEEQRVLGAAEHCTDCEELADGEWHPIGSLPEIGDTACNVRCKCTFIYR